MPESEFGPFIAIGNDELGGEVGDAATCPHCRELHPLEYGTTGGRENRQLGFVKCPGSQQAYLVSLGGRAVPPPRAPEPTEPITKTPGVCGGRACVANTRIPVWLIWGFVRMQLRDDAILDSYPTLQQHHLDAARAYCRLHLEEILQDLMDNQEDADD